MRRSTSKSSCLVTLLILLIFISLGTWNHPLKENPEGRLTEEGITLNGYPLGTRDLADVESLLARAQGVTRIASANGGRIDDGIIPARWGLKLNVQEILRRLADAPPGARLEATYVLQTPGRNVKQEQLPARAAAPGLNAVGLMVNVAWGGEHLEDLLAVLREHGARATFFVMGAWAADNPDAVSTIAGEGHEIGAHGHHDRHPRDMTPGEFRDDLLECVELLHGLTGRHPTVYTPHYGEVMPFTVTEAASLELKTVLWTADTADWLLESVDQMLKRVISKTQDGSLILMHPTDKTPDFLRRYLEFLRGEGLDTLSCGHLLSPVPAPPHDLAEVLATLDEDHQPEEGGKEDGVSAR